MTGAHREAHRAAGRYLRSACRRLRASSLVEHIGAVASVASPVGVRVLAAAVALVAVSTGTAPVAAQEATLDDFAWLAGTWRGPGPEGAVAEIRYMSPAAGVMPALFRLYRSDRVLIMEVVSLVREDGGLFLYVRHFDTALVPLEADHAIKLRLTGRDGNTFVFENVRQGENPVRTVMVRTTEGFTSWSELARAQGHADTIRVAYRKVIPD